MEEQETQNKEPVIGDEEMKMPDEQFGTYEPEKKRSMLGPILGVLIVILVLILGGLYLWGTTLKDEPAPIVQPDIVTPTVEEDNVPTTSDVDGQVEALETVSASDEIDAIEADIESTNLDALDSELSDIDAELDAALE